MIYPEWKERDHIREEDDSSFRVTCNRCRSSFGGYGTLGEAQAARSTYLTEECFYHDEYERAKHWPTWYELLQQKPAHRIGCGPGSNLGSKKRAD